MDPAAWLVYGDWLQSVGDPRGELVAVQARLARDPGNPALMAAERALFAEHGAALLEGLHEYLRPARGSPILMGSEDGSPPPARRDGPDGDGNGDLYGPLLHLSWEFGFLWTATFKREGHSLRTFMDGLRALVTHPSAHFLHALSLGAPPKNDWQSVVSILSEAARPLRLLYLGDSALTSLGDPRPGYAPLGDLSRLWRGFPHLQCLAIRGGVMSLGNLELSSLRELTVETSALERGTLTALGTREWPHLEKLELWFGERRCTCTLPDLEPIFDGSLFPRLRHLAIRNCAFVDRVCHTLARATITKQLHVLDLSLGAFTERGLDSLVSGRASFEHLAVLDLHHHYIDMERMRAPEVSSLARFVDVSGPRYDVEAYENAEPGPPKVWLDA